MFPEGTRTTRQPVNHFHASFTLIARRANAPIQAVFIDTDSPYLGKGWPLWRLPPLPIRFSVRMGQRYAPAEDYLALRDRIEDILAGREYSQDLPGMNPEDDAAGDGAGDEE